MDMVSHPYHQDSRRGFLRSGLASVVVATTAGVTPIVKTGRAFAQQLGDKRSDVIPTVGFDGPPLDTSANTYVLFLDMQEVEELVLCKQVVNQAKKHSHNPVLGPGDVHDWDGAEAANWAGSLIYDAQDNLFKMWYVGRDIKGVRDGKFRGAIGYAVSEDGVVWHKPMLVTCPQ